jgi:hypothetical protein
VGCSTARLCMREEEGAVGRRDPGAFSQLLISPDRPKTQPTQAVTPVLALSLFDLAGRYLTEEEAETHMIRQLQDPKNDSYQEFKHKTRTVARLDTDKLVGALNEHVSNGWAGREGSGHPSRPVMWRGVAMPCFLCLLWFGLLALDVTYRSTMPCPALPAAHRPAQGQCCVPSQGLPQGT